MTALNPPVRVSRTEPGSQCVKDRLGFIEMFLMPGSNAGHFWDSDGIFRRSAGSMRTTSTKYSIFSPAYSGTAFRSGNQLTKRILHD